VHDGRTGNLLKKEETEDIRANMARGRRRIRGFWAMRFSLQRSWTEAGEIKEISDGGGDCSPCLQTLFIKGRVSGSGKDRRLSKVRAIAAGLVLESGRLTLAELSKRVARDSSTIERGGKASGATSANGHRSDPIDEQDPGGLV
jgi:hypothetical protein